MPTLTDELPTLLELLDLYDAVGWRAYTADPARLERAIRASGWCRAAWDGPRLVGFARALTDGATVVLLQDVLVRPSAQRQGIGRALVQACLDEHADVRQMILLTDDRPAQHAFYRSLGLSDVSTLTRTRLHAFVRFAGVELG